MKKLFTERLGMALPQVGEELNRDATFALLALVEARIEENWFGEQARYWDDLAPVSSRRSPGPADITARLLRSHRHGAGSKPCY